MDKTKNLLNLVKSSFTKKNDKESEEANANPFKNAKYLIKLVKAFEATNVLKSSTFKQYEPQRVEITKEIFKSLMNETPLATPAAKGIANTYLAAYPFPITAGLKAYDPLDLVLALNHHYLDDIHAGVWALRSLMLHDKDALAIAKALCSDFDPLAIPEDLQRRKAGLLGEFRRYAGKGHIYYTAIEMQRPAQYTALELGDYHTTDRAIQLQALAQAEPVVWVTPDTATPKPSLMERIEAKRISRATGTPTPPEPPVQAQESPDPAVEVVEDDIDWSDLSNAPSEDYDDAYAGASDDYSDEGGVDFSGHDDDDVEAMDDDDADWASKLDD
ncbi:hypothetical protein E6W26_28975 [Pseudomonas aeruginosa]|uniref:hypothetical protein n=1 Tax=Pseudomonas aeruginosa TaxID=287 RepID=UPI00109DA149|nr:hypothetical protein [Pseudomonas aeruginosa]EKV1241293.1 hypothetical protein [Pseudomonas aeruginosa]EKV8586202.1 hypothetical protein [Pseudomonas aeruginosa]ELN5407420.1 hypothetical protein [Pseudomonas aeruginosa]ELP1438611.1 hypothetical protein [Pseudomonas aeruginosa]THB16432.1 hypothetical protein E6W26_28975 [Pseudomonas aeruginosa]